jgi:hypothetical protein
MASKGLSGAAPVLEGYGLSCEHDLSLLVQEDLNALSSQLTPFHSRILRTWVQGLAAADSFVLRALLTNAPNSCPPERLFSMFNATFGEDQYNKRNL